RRGGGRNPPRIPSEQEAERELERTERAGAAIVAIGEPEYPMLLAQMDNAPPLVTVKGGTDIFMRPAVAIVGSRNASAAGTRIAARIAAGLGEAGYAVVSGLARGIDAAAHQASLETGTIAALAGGIDRPYPPENIPLFERIPE